MIKTFYGAVFSYGAVQCGVVRFNRTVPHTAVPHRRILEEKNAPHRTVINKKKAPHRTVEYGGNP